MAIYNVRLHANPEAGTGESWHLYTGPPAKIEAIVKHYSELFFLVIELGGRGFALSTEAEDSTDDPILQNWEAGEIIATDVDSGEKFFYSDSWEPYDNG